MSDFDKSPQRGTRQRNEILSSQLKSALQNSVSDIPETVRRHVILHYGEDLSYEEIAYIAGTSAGGIRVAVHRAINRLRDRLEEKLGESLADANLGHALRAIELPPLVPKVEPSAVKLLTALINDPESLSAGDRAAVEDRLAQDAECRLFRALSGRRAEAEFDVRGHCGDEKIPTTLLAHLLRRAHEAFNPLQQ